MHLYSVYMPNAWDTNAAVEHVYAVLDLLLQNSDHMNATPIIGGDFNASCRMRTQSIWVIMGAETIMLVVRCCTDGSQNMAFKFFTRVCRAPHSDGWTCKRAIDAAFVQIDFVNVA